MSAGISSLLLVGCGKMGGALLERWKEDAQFRHIDVIDPHHAQEKNESIASGRTISWYRSVDSLPQDYKPGVIVLAIKPQKLEVVLSEYQRRFSGSSPLYISIAAGKTLQFYTNYLGVHAHIVRAMPNTPSLIGQGMTVLCASSTLPASQKKTATDIMHATGKVEWLDDESLMDAVTAISGCGPAYVFLFLDCLIKAGVAAGLPEGLTRLLVTQTVIGSVALAEHGSKTFEQLRSQVASPGGSTEAALSVLMHNDKMQNLIREAVLSAKKRSDELAQIW